MKNEELIGKLENYVSKLNILSSILSNINEHYSYFPKDSDITIKNINETSKDCFNKIVYKVIDLTGLDGEKVSNIIVENGCIPSLVVKYLIKEMNGG